MAVKSTAAASDLGTKEKMTTIYANGAFIDESRNPIESADDLPVDVETFAGFVRQCFADRAVKKACCFLTADLAIQVAVDPVEAPVGRRREFRQRKTSVQILVFRSD